MVKELKIGNCYKVLKRLAYHAGMIEAGELFTIIDIQKGSSRPDPYLEYPDYPVDSFYISVLHDNQTKRIKTFIKDHYTEIEEVL